MFKLLQIFMGFLFGSTRDECWGTIQLSCILSHLILKFWVRVSICSGWLWILPSYTLNLQRCWDYRNMSSHLYVFSRGRLCYFNCSFAVKYSENNELLLRYLEVMFNFIVFVLLCSFFFKLVFFLYFNRNIKIAPHIFAKT